MSVISVETKTISDLTAITSLEDADVVVVERSSGGTRKMTVANFGSEIVGIQYMDVLKREQECINGTRRLGEEWDVDDLMTLVKAGNFDRFAIGDYFTDTTGYQWAVAGKMFYPMWAFGGSYTSTPNHITLMMVDPIGSYAYNSSNTNSSGYEGSTLRTTLSSIYATLISSSIRTAGYVVSTRAFMNAKGSWASASHTLRLPTTVEVTGHTGWAANDGYSNGVSGQLPLCRNTRFRVCEDPYWLADPSSSSTTSFSAIHNNGSVTSITASTTEPIRPIITMA